MQAGSTSQNSRLQMNAISLRMGLVLGSLILVGVPFRNFIAPIHPSMWLEAGIGLLFCIGSVVATRTMPTTRLPGILLILAFFSFLPGPTIRSAGIDTPIFAMFILSPIIGAFVGGTMVSILSYIVFLSLGIGLHLVHVSGLPEGTDIQTFTKARALIYFLSSTISLALGLIYENVRAKREELAIKAAEHDGTMKMLRTFCHEINNPLMIATGNLARFRTKGNPEYMDKIEYGLERIEQVVKRAETVAKQGQVKHEVYVRNQKMVSLPKAG